ncbi:MAG: membrane associated rhomboid family serine protease [Cryomorphaceae bacterium]|jgi:membrane associated rhomboid family serine protease
MIMSEHLSSTSSTKRKWTNIIPQSFRGLLLAVAFVWGLEIIDLLPGVNLDTFGVHPRSIFGLIGIPLMPFLHGDFSHLLSNTFPFLILGWIVLQAEKENFIVATVTIILLGGIGTWLIGRNNSVHIGASGLVYGYFGYVMVRAFMERRPKWIATGLFVGIFYGSMIFGMLPTFNQELSWEGHLCGMAAGMWFGWRRSKEMKALITLPVDPFAALGK